METKSIKENYTDVIKGMIKDLESIKLNEDDIKKITQKMKTDIEKIKTESNSDK